MELNFVYLIVAALLGGWVFVFWFLKRVNEWYYVGRVGEMAYPLPPGDMGWPFIGNMLSLMKCLRAGDPNSFIYNLVSRYRNSAGIYKMHLLGSPTVVVYTPELCRRVLTNEEHFKHGYPKSTDLLTGRKGLQNTSNAEHRRLRRIIANPINGHQALAIYVEHIEDVVINSLDEWASMNKPFELLTEMKRAIVKAMTRIFIGSISDSTFSTTQNLFNDYFEGLVSMAIDIPGFAFHKAFKAKKELVKVLQSVLDEKRMTAKSNDEHKGKKDMMDLLMEVEDEDGQKLEDEDIVALLVSFFAAGFGSTTTNTLRAIVHLSEHPEALKKAKEEQEDITKRRPSTQKGLNFKDIKQMQYLAKVIDEMLRITSLTGLFREAKIDISIDGYTIPKGWKVFVWLGIIHMDPETYESPQDFNPSRWDNIKTKGGAFLPFGAGSRSCPGMDLSKLVITIFLHLFLLNYKLKRINPESPLHYSLMGSMVEDNYLVEIIKIP
ncbi:beta-amyrin 11-oxidase-like [Corylus avellana]|uniref:beta-amyrin 11-oxidase-like n=1 Tax=Corylus avellana TaxID=13451 RepID=UPI002869F8D4|nr:beta-amyrin 11-oxidase-like [Corylus avellana]